MPSWTDKDRRQYEHIKESEIERGRSEDVAEEIAGRTTNKHRRLDGRTPNRTTQGTGNPNTRLEERSVNELRSLAAERNVRGRSRMKKQELIEALRNR